MGGILHGSASALETCASCLSASAGRESMNGGAVCDEGCVEGCEQVHLEPGLISAGGVSWRCARVLSVWFKHAVINVLIVKF